MRIEIVVARSCFTIFALTISIAIAMAQSSKLPDPADASAAVPAVKYESAFSDYQPFREHESTSWKQVNNEVADNPGMGHRRQDLTDYDVFFWTALKRYAVIYRKTVPIAIVRVISWRRLEPALLTPAGGFWM